MTRAVMAHPLHWRATDPDVLWSPGSRTWTDLTRRINRTGRGSTTDIPIRRLAVQAKGGEDVGVADRASGPPTPAPARRRRPRLLGILASLLAVLTLGGVGYAGWFRVTYGSFPGLDIGDRITWCDTDFRRTVTDLTETEVATDPGHPIVPAFRYPPMLARDTVYAAMRPAAELAKNPALACAPELYVRTGPDRYTRFLPAGTE